MAAVSAHDIESSPDDLQEETASELNTWAPAWHASSMHQAHSKARIQHACGMPYLYFTCYLQHELSNAFYIKHVNEV